MANLLDDNDYNAYLTTLEEGRGLPPGSLRAIARQESGGNSNAVSPKGAKGTFQFMPATAKQYGVNTDDPVSSATGAANFMADLMKQYDGNFDAALAHYNGGHSQAKAVINAGMPTYPETKNYVQRIKTGMNTPTAKTQAEISDEEAIAYLQSKQPKPAAKSEDEISDEEAIAYLQAQKAPTNTQPEKKGPGLIQDTIDTAKDLRRGAQRGLSFGFNDEIKGAFDAAIGWARGQGNFGDLYTQERDKERALNKESEERSPIASTIGQVAGGAAPAVLTAGGSTIPSMIGQGAAYGAAYGAGESEADNLRDFAGDVASGAGMGGAAGGAFGVGAKAVGAGVKAGQKAVAKGKEVVDALQPGKKVGPVVEQVQAMINSLPEGSPARQVLEEAMAKATTGKTQGSNVAERFKQDLAKGVVANKEAFTPEIRAQLDPMIKTLEDLNRETRGIGTAWTAAKKELGAPISPLEAGVGAVGAYIGGPVGALAGTVPRVGKAVKAGKAAFNRRNEYIGENAAKTGYENAERKFASGELKPGRFSKIEDALETPKTTAEKQQSARDTFVEQQTGGKSPLNDPDTVERFGKGIDAARVEAGHLPGEQQRVYDILRSDTPKPPKMTIQEKMDTYKNSPEQQAANAAKIKELGLEDQSYESVMEFLQKPMPARAPGVKVPESTSPPYDWSLSKEAMDTFETLKMSPEQIKQNARRKALEKLADNPTQVTESAADRAARHAEIVDDVKKYGPGGKEQAKIDQALLKRDLEGIQAEELPIAGEVSMSGLGQEAEDAAIAAQRAKLKKAKADELPVDDVAAAEAPAMDPQADDLIAAEQRRLEKPKVSENGHDVEHIDVTGNTVDDLLFERFGDEAIPEQLTKDIANLERQKTGNKFRDQMLDKKISWLIQDYKPKGQ